LAVTVSVGRCFDRANQNKITSSLHSTFKIILPFFMSSLN
jgi:hypothetical protein